MSYSVREIVDPADWELLRDIRLKALRTDPGAFQRTLEEEAAKDEEDWRQLIASLKTAVFVLYEADIPIGMTGIGIYEEQVADRVARLWGTWLEPRFRRKGLAAMLRQAAIAWAKAHPKIDTVFLLHRTPEEIEKFAALGLEPRLTDSGERLWPDGKLDTVLRYEICVGREVQPC